MNNIRQMNYWTLGGFEGKKPVAQALAEASAMGLGGIELTFGAGEFARGITEAQCRAIRAKAAHLNLRIETLATGYYWDHPLSSPDAAERCEAIAFTKEYLRVAARVGAKVVLVVPGAVAVPWDPSKPVVPYAAVWKNATASLRICLKEAEKQKVTMALENVWNWFLADPMAMKLFVDQFKSRRVGVYLDVGNCLINGYPEHWIEILGRRIAAVHFKNFARQDCGGGIHGFGDDLLKGDVNWKAVLAALAKIKYKGPITAEMVPFSRLPDLVLPDMVLARDTVAKLKQILAMA
ncbi:MAG: sugar phosphate isomerase/epimerase [Verrucomicrobia bacterium]|nr:sugar phosphate isomerase/epimerase [Verrucomicrobiota bacterium]